MDLFYHTRAKLTSGLAVFESTYDYGVANSLDFTAFK